MIQLLLLPLFLFLAPNHQINGQLPTMPSIANVNTTWKMDIGSMEVLGTERFQPILTSNQSQHENHPLFSCGFICNYNIDLGFKCLFGTLIFPNRSTTNDQQLVWSANRNNPISTSGTLKLVDGNLVLMDANGKSVWATSTGGDKSVKGLKLSENGNLMLFNPINVSKVIWQSFDYPTDTLLPGQVILSDHSKLVSNNSAIDLGDGLYSLFVQNNILVAQFSSNHHNYTYYTYQDLVRINVLGRAYFEYPYSRPTNPARFVRLEVDGHLRSYEWRSQTGNSWVVDDDIFSTGIPSIGACEYPKVCGNYGICSEGQCSCPKVEKISFHYILERQPNLGCEFDHAPSFGCQSSSYYNEFVEIKNVSYFGVKTMSNYQTNLSTCRTSCLKNCSCKSILFRELIMEGDCFLLSEVFTLMNTRQESEFNSTLFVKVQLPKRKTNQWRVVVILSTSIGSTILGGLVIVILWVIQFRKKKKLKLEADHECFINQVEGIPSIFSFEQLRLATDNFKRKLGEGGFGTVFEGILSNGTKVAVKCLYNKLDLTEGTFLAEVQTIGSIHHVNLVRLVGYCMEKSHRLLVYEFMSNGSLYEWIFPKKQVVSLRWELRRKIVIDVAKGLAYLHGECRQKIFHLDIKPQNILLDENLNAKVSDFGLSKLIDKDQSKVVTTMKGTPGYMAPEWLSSIITEKVDVYSFGVMVFEVLCGRKNVDLSQTEEDIYLLSIFKRKAEEGRLLDLVDKNSENMQKNGKEVVEMMKVAAWCLQFDYEKRPSMSTVVQVLEGLANVEDLISCNFENQIVQSKSEVASDSVLDPVHLSGPRNFTKELRKLSPKVGFINNGFRRARTFFFAIGGLSAKSRN